MISKFPSWGPLYVDRLCGGCRERAASMCRDCCQMKYSSAATMLYLWLCIMWLMCLIIRSAGCRGLMRLSTLLLNCQNGIEKSGEDCVSCNAALSVGNPKRLFMSRILNV